LKLWNSFCRLSLSSTITTASSIQHNTFIFLSSNVQLYSTTLTISIIISLNNIKLKLFPWHISVIKGISLISWLSILNLVAVCISAITLIVLGLLYCSEIFYMILVWSYRKFYLDRNRKTNLSNSMNFSIICQNMKIISIADLCSLNSCYSLQMSIFCIIYRLVAW